MDDRKTDVKSGIGADPDIRGLLKEIEKEKVPERLLKLARELQAALAAHNEKGSHGNNG